MLVIGGTILWLLPFLLARWDAGPLQHVDRKARWGMLLEFSAVGLMVMGALWPVPPQPWHVVVSVLYFEDRLLEARFGEQFWEYRRSTRAYLP